MLAKAVGQVACSMVAKVESYLARACLKQLNQPQQREGPAVEPGLEGDSVEDLIGTSFP